MIRGVEQKIKDKVLVMDDLIQKVRELRSQGKVVVQSHGVFDLIHPGIVKHLNEARKQGDVLVVTVIKDRDVRRGPGRPVFPEEFRAENVASLEQVSYACIVDDDKPFECVRMLEPDVFAKGQAYKERDRRIHERIFEEEREFYFGKCRVCETEGFSFSSSEIINNFLDIYPEETRSFLKRFSKKYSFDEITDRLESLKNLNVLILGDGIVDEYHYCTPMGKATKAHLVVNRYLTHEVFAGGSFAVSNHLAGICDRVHLVTLLGSDESREDFIRSSLKPNIDTKFFYRRESPTIVKKRYVDQYLNQKLFEVNYLCEDFIDEDQESEIIKYLENTLPMFDLVLVSDFGHGFITNGMIEVLERCSRKIAVNTQTNAANAGYNMITRYRHPNFICLDEPEARLATQGRFSDIAEIARKISRLLDPDHMIITLGKKGCIGLNRKDEAHRTPIFSSKVVDTVGAGDAFFSFTAPAFARDLPLDLVSFIGNAVGALAVQIVCNKKPVEKYELLQFVHSLLK
jgi:cytidyltransferase-like protein